MIKAMLFIDGSWLYANLSELGKVYGRPDFQIDFGKLPTVLAEDIAEQAGIGAIDLVRTYYFASYAENYDARDVAAVQRRMAFFSRLKEDYNYEVEAFPINYQGRRLRRADRDPADDFVPKEKCVDISLAITVMHYATMPSAMDVAILLIGDRDFVPLLQDIRRRGIRVAVASIYGSCAQELADPADAARVRDFDVIWLNDLLDRVEYVPADEQPAGPHHQGGAGATRRVWTTNVPRWGRRSHWLATRDALLLRGSTAAAAIGADGYAAAAAAVAAELTHAAAAGFGEVLRGRIKNIIWDRGFGFIAADDGPDYFFHANALEEGLSFDELQPEMEVVFEVKTPPTPMRAGAALSVRRATAVAAAAEADDTAGEEPADGGVPARPEAAAEAGEAGGAVEAGGASGEAAPATVRTGLGADDECGGPAPAGAAQRQDADRPSVCAVAAAVAGEVLRGRIKNVIWDRGFGFIAADDGPDYFFHANGLVGDLRFELLQPGMSVLFEVRSRPTTLRAGAALNVRRCAGVEAVGAAQGGGAEADDEQPSPAEKAAAPSSPASSEEPDGPGDDGAGEDEDRGAGPAGPRAAEPAAAENLEFSTANAAPDRSERP